MSWFADREKGIIKAYANDLMVAEIKTDQGFEFGLTPLTIGKLANGERYFKGSIDDVVILRDNAVTQS